MSLIKHKKLIFVVTEDWYFCSHRLPLAEFAIRAGYEVIVATRVTDHERVIKNAGLKVIPLKHWSRSSLNPLKEFRALLELLSIYRAEKPDIVHQVALKPVLYGTLAAKLVRLKAWVNALGGLGFVFASKKRLARLLKPLLLILLRLLLNDRRGRLIVQNQEDYKYLVAELGIRRKLVSVIRGAGVDLDSYVDTPLLEGTPIVMLASRMLWEKGISEFYEAAKILKQENVNARFILVGKPDPENPSSVPVSQLCDWHDTGFVEWWGYCEDMPKTLSKASIVCLPSYYREGIPKVLIEAMACSRPIITTDTPGCRELVVRGENGLLVEPRSVNSLADAIKTLVLDKPGCYAMGRRCREIVEAEYALKKVVEQTFLLYQDAYG